MIVRISRGHFDAGAFDDVDHALRDGAATLVPAISRLPGCLHYYVGIDRASATMVNVSVWDTLAHAQQMSTLKEMQEAGDAFRARGVRFDPILNYETMWDITG